MKKESRNLLNLLTWRRILVAVILIIVGIFAYFIGTDMYFRSKHNTLLKKYLTDPEKKVFAEAIVKDDKDLSSNPTKSKKSAAILDMGLEWYNLREYDLAIWWWKQDEIKNDIGWYNLGNAYTASHNYGDAESAYKKAISVSTQGFIDGCLALGELYKYSYVSKSDQQDNVYLECLKKFPKNRDLIARLALYYRDTGDKKNALKYFDELFAIEPTLEVSEELRKLRMEPNQ